MRSPGLENRQGSSKTTGGFSRKHALGNAPNFSDMNIDSEPRFLRPSSKARVAIYTNQVEDPTISPAKWTISVNKVDSFKLLLEQVSDKMEEVKCKSICNFIFHIFFKTISAGKILIWDKEIAGWELKGTYLKTVTDDDQVEWDHNGSTHLIMSP